MRRSQRSDAERLVKRLDEEIRSRGHGSIRAADRAAGRKAGWWQHCAETGDLRIHQMLAVLDHLGLDPVSFVRRALAAEGSFDLDRPRGRVPEIVSKALARAQDGREGGALGVSFIATLDAQRHGDPAEVARVAFWAVEHIEMALLPRLLGVAGSAFWAMLRLEDAEHAIHAALKIAQGQKNRAIVGDLLCRLSYVVSARGDRAEALRIAERAAVVSLRAGARDEVGRALVAQGIWLYYLARPQDALESLKAALDYLAKDSSRNRFAVFQVSGLAHQSLGDLPAALEAFDAAEGALPADNEWARGKLLWFRGKIYSDMERWREASAMFEEVIAIFCELHHGETALATCELVRLQLVQGQYRAAYETATRMRALLQPLRHNKIISAAIGDLLRQGQTGLTLALVQEVMTRIEGERQKGIVWQSLRPAGNQPPGSKAGPIFTGCPRTFE